MARIPTNIVERQELFQSLATQLGFPTYFGQNWDALYDLLCDFSWLDPRYRYIIIIHSELPLKQKKGDIRTYLEILRDAVGSWKPSEEHELVVLFPTGLYEQIRTLLQK
jgi:hypothetical protein